MDKKIALLSKCNIFRGINEDEINSILKEISFRFISYKKDETIAIEESECNGIGIVLKGNIEVQKSFPSGKIITLNTFKEGNIFGEAIVFSEKHVYPATIVSVDNAEIMFINKNDIIRLCRLNDKFLNNFMTILSDRILMLNNRIKNLSYGTIRQKVANLILEEYKKQKSVYIEFPYTRKKMAEILDIPRPSLSRELVNMKKECIIDFDKNFIKILKIKLLEEYLFN